MNLRWVGRHEYSHKSQTLKTLDMVLPLYGFASDMVLLPALLVLHNPSGLQLVIASV